LQRILSEFNNEKRIHEHCRDQRLSRVTKIYDHGVEVVSGQGVHFLVCEYAERSLRNYHPPGEESVPTHHRLVALRKIASALVQLHASGVSHQDVKPCNAVYFEDDRIKITDLGSASCIHLPAPPHDDDPFVGQPNYAPYELLYKLDAHSNWHRRRYGCDVFLLGNLIFTSFVGCSLTPLAMHALNERLWPANFSGEYDEVLPDLISAHALLIPAFLEECVSKSVVTDVIQLVSSLCHPDPTKRGLSRSSPQGSNAFDLHRCVGTLNTLATRARLHELRQG
jgi:serine/threonine protein kinase